MPPEFVCRAARPADALCLSVLATQVFLDTYATGGVNLDLAREATGVYSAAAFSRRLDDAGVEITVVERGDCLVGFLDLCFKTGSPLPLPFSRGAEVVRLYVQAPFQARGIGRHLMGLAEARAVARQLDGVWLTAWAGNTRALAFYAALGYRDVGETPYIIEGQAYENRVFAKPLGATRHRP